MVFQRAKTVRSQVNETRSDQAMIKVRRWSVVLLSAMLLLGCASEPKKKVELTPEQKAELQQQRIEQQQKLKAQKIAEARALGLLDMTDEQKVAFMKDFLSRLRAKQASGCDLVNDIAYYSKQWYLARCRNGFEFPVSVQGNELFALRMRFVELQMGVDPELAVWFLGGQTYP